MKRAKIESSNILSIGYDINTLTLEIEFKKGRIYRYHPVSKHMWNSFLNADSKGQYFADNIRGNKRITFEEVDELQAD